MTDEEFRYDVFISYSWSYNKEVVDRLYHHLAENGIRAWKDDEGGMSGSTIRSMQNGVRSSRTMIICATNAYFASKMCRLELDFG